MSRGSQEKYEFACLIVKETDRAILLHDFASGEDVWIPLSQVDEIHHDTRTQTARVVMSAWIAKQKGLI